MCSSSSAIERGTQNPKNDADLKGFEPKALHIRAEDEVSLFDEVLWAGGKLDVPSIPPEFRAAYEELGGEVTVGTASGGGSGTSRYEGLLAKKPLQIQ